MNILLISARRSAYTGENISAPHRGILSLAATLREGTFCDTAGVNIEVVDDQLTVIERPWAPPGACLVGRHPDVVGVQVTTSSLKSGIKLLDEVRFQFPHALTVLGGVGAGALAGELVEKGAAEIVVRGEAERSFSRLISVYHTEGRGGFHKVEGITFRNEDGMVVHTPPPLLIQDLDALPLPARDLIDMRYYQKISHGRAGNLVTSRGCSYACAYCYSRHHWGIGQRNRSVDNVMQELQLLVEEYGVDRIRIEDDDFLEDKAWVYAFCQAIEDAGYHHKLEWEAKARPDHIEPEIVRRLRQANCFRLLVGIETLDPVLLKRMNRPLNLTILENALELLYQGGIGVQGTMILGIPGETNQAMRHTLTWLQGRLGRNRRDIISPCFFVPFNSEIVHAMKRKNEFTIEVHDTDTYTGHIPVTSSPACSIEELNQLYEDMTPTRRGMYRRIAHLATLEEVQGRVEPELPVGAHS